MLILVARESHRTATDRTGQAESEGERFILPPALKQAASSGNVQARGNLAIAQSQSELFCGRSLITQTRYGYLNHIGSKTIPL